MSVPESVCDECGAPVPVGACSCNWCGGTFCEDHAAPGEHWGCREDEPDDDYEGEDEDDERDDGDDE